MNSSNQIYLKGFIEEMRLLKSSKTFVHRQSFCGMVQSILSSDDLEITKQFLIKNFLPDLQDLSTDKVINVRITLAQAFNCLLKKY